MSFGPVDVFATELLFCGTYLFVFFPPVCTGSPTVSASLQEDCYIWRETTHDFILHCLKKKDIVCFQMYKLQKFSSFSISYIFSFEFQDNFICNTK